MKLEMRHLKMVRLCIRCGREFTMNVACGMQPGTIWQAGCLDRGDLVPVDRKDNIPYRLSAFVAENHRKDAMERAAEWMKKENR